MNTTTIRFALVSLLIVSASALTACDASLCDPDDPSCASASADGSGAMAKGVVDGTVAYPTRPRDRHNLITVQGSGYTRAQATADAWDQARNTCAGWYGAGSFPVYYGLAWHSDYGGRVFESHYFNCSDVPRERNGLQGTGDFDWDVNDPCNQPFAPDMYADTAGFFAYNRNCY